MSTIHAIDWSLVIVFRVINGGKVWMLKIISIEKCPLRCGIAGERADLNFIVDDGTKKDSFKRSDG